MRKFTKMYSLNIKLIRRMLLALNTIFLLIGVLLTTIGATMHAVYNEFEIFIDSHFFKPVVFIISVGSIVIAISIFGYIGSIKKSTMLVNIYALLLFLMLIIEGALVIIGFKMSGSIYSHIETNMFSTMSEYYNINNPAKEAWDFMQQRLRCCGVNSPFNWGLKDAVGPQSMFMGVPESCCKDETCLKIYTKGCLSVLGKYATDSIVTITFCATVVFVVQIFGSTLAYMLAKAIRQSKIMEEMERQKNRQMLFEELARGQGEKVAPVLAPCFAK